VLLSTQLNTAPPSGTAYVPACNQWGRKAFVLPNGTNRIRFNATTANDNNLYIDSICSMCLTGIRNPNSGIPATYTLGQNYPNPFNPATKINFSIPNSTETGAIQTRLVVYDALGKSIATLVDEQLKPGQYEVTFDGANYASGVYFYEIQSGSFAERKKMVLIK